MHVTACPGMTTEQASEVVLAELSRAVAMRKMADVPVGVFLSGGVDSSTNAVLFAKGERRPVQTFTVGYTSDAVSYPSELSYAKSVSELVGSEHHEVSTEPAGPGRVPAYDGAGPGRAPGRPGLLPALPLGSAPRASAGCRWCRWGKELTSSSPVTRVGTR